MDAFTRQYIATALWASTDNKGNPLDREHDASGIAEESLAQIVADCTKFQDAFSHLFTEENCLRYGPGPTERAGYDFFLTRHGHGAGFWDGDWAEPAAIILTDGAKEFRESEPYIGDDGRVYFS